MSSPSLPPTEIIHRALKVLAGVCDFAQRPDGVGFNAFDTAFGHELAMLPMITTTQATVALKMLRKYSKQLSEYGIILPDDLGSPSARSENGRIYLEFAGKPDIATRDWLKSITGFRWHPDMAGMPWSLPHTAENAQAVLNKFGITLPEPTEPVKLTPAQPHKVEPVTARPEVAFQVKNNSILVTFPVFNRANVDLVKTLPERKWLPDDPGKPWSVPSRLAMRLVEMFPTAAGIEQLTDLANHQKELAKMSNKATGAKSTLKGLTGTLYPFQHIGVEFLDKANGRALIADECGLGKTIQAIAYLAQHPELRPAVIVVPASLKLNWRNEITKWLKKPERVAVVSGTKTYDLSITGASIAIINYDILNAWKEKVVEWKPEVIISDESHYLKSGNKSLRGKAMQEVAKSVSRVILLTGTPILNRPNELWPLLNIIAPKDFSSGYKFVMRYCDPKQVLRGDGKPLLVNGRPVMDFSGASNLDELFDVTRPYIIRRRKDQVLTELPPKVWANLAIEFDPAMQKEYQAEVARAEMEVAEMSNAQQLVMIEKLKQLAVKAKLPGIITWITDFLETGEKLLVFATHHSTIHALEEAFPDISVTVTGETAVNKRQSIVERFQTDGNIKLFFGNIQAAGVGLTLTAASNVLFIEFPWRPGDLVQSADRTHRIGQENSVTIYMAAAEGTIDEDIIELLQEKAKIIDAATDGSEVETVDIMGELVKRIISKKY